MPVAVKAAGFSYVLLCTRRLKIPSHLRTLSEFLKSRAKRLTAHLKATYVHSENSCTSMYTRIFFRTRVAFICTIIRIALCVVLCRCFVTNLYTLLKNSVLICIENEKNVRNTAKILLTFCQNSSILPLS